MKKIIVVVFLGAYTTVQAQNAFVPASVTKLQLLQAQQYATGGKGFNPTKAFELFTQYAQQGSAEAMNALGILYKKGVGTMASTDKAKDWFTKAADAGYVKGLWLYPKLCYRFYTICQRCIGR